MTNQDIEEIEMSRVGIVQSNKAWAGEIDYKEIKKMVEDAVNLAGGFEGIIKDSSVVVIKPNLVNIRDSKSGELLNTEINGITVDWRVSKAVVELVRKYNPTGKVYIMEGSAEESTLEVMKSLNYTPAHIKGVDEFIAIEEDSGGWKDYNSPLLEKVLLHNGLIHKEYYLNKRYKNADVLISLACLKTHSSAVITGGIKNLSIGATPANIYGVAPGNPSRMNMVQHDNVEGDLHKWLHDFYLCRKADFVIIDGLQGFQNGPGSSYVNSSKEDVMNMRLIIAGSDGVAVDTTSALVMNWDPETINYLKYLENSHVGNMDTTKILVSGKSVQEIRRSFKTVKIAPAGGKSIKDIIPPRIEIKGLKKEEKQLHITLMVEEKTRKIEIFVDDKLQKVVTQGFSDIVVDLERESYEGGNLSLCAYDRFMNCNKLVLSI